MLIYRVKIKNNLLGDFYSAKKKPAKGTIIFMAGLPSYMHKSQFSETLSFLGYNIIQPFYYGSWVSGGEFTIRNCVKTVDDTIKALKRGNIFDLYSKKTIHIVPKNLYLGGISFGTNIIQSSEILDEIKKIFLISCVPIFKKTYVEQIHFNGKSFVRFIKSGFSNSYRSKNWNGLIKEFSGDGKILNQFKANQKKIDIYQGSTDKISPRIISNYLSAEKIASKLHIIKNSGHALNEFNQISLAKLIDKNLNN